MGNAGKKSIWDEWEGLNANLGPRVSGICGFREPRLEFGASRVPASGWGPWVCSGGRLGGSSVGLWSALVVGVCWWWFVKGEAAT